MKWQSVFVQFFVTILDRKQNDFLQTFVEIIKKLLCLHQVNIQDLKSLSNLLHSIPIFHSTRSKSSTTKHIINPLYKVYNNRIYEIY
jgi:hypothetical protein